MLVRRDNSLLIREDGISSNHLLIASESGKWKIQDLDSTNGTSLNSTRLSPREPCLLSNNDTVKIGESTSILVRLASQSRRNPRRAARGAAEIEPVMEDPSIEARRSEENEEVVNLESNRRGKRMKNKESDNLASIGMKPRELRRSTRLRENRGGLVFVNLEEGNREVRGGRNKRKNLQELPQEKDMKSVCVGEDEKHSMEEEHVEQIESKKPPRGRPRRKGLQELVVEEVCIGVNKQEGLGNSETKKGQESRKKSENLQEMGTLEDWFDYMEDHWPRQIIQATEEMIEVMRRKAERVNAYIMEQKRERVVQ